MNTAPIFGTFTLKSNEDGDWYEVSFKPDRDQIWSAQPQGWIVKFSGAHCVDEVENLVGADRPDNLRDARLHGFAQFSGHVTRDQYWKPADCTSRG
ncbi:MAG TPA: hypothetical protein VNF27_05155 [Candidatus Binataceae bacterium]|nr:hypothetical protein [Candidatus Binataceae bacterium]